MYRILSLTLCLVLSPAGAASAGDLEIDAAVRRALPVVRTGGVSWIEKRSCVSCHRVSFMTWALDRAAAAGFAVDAKELAGWQDWSREALLTPRKEDDVTVGSRNLEGVAQILWATRGNDSALGAETRETFVRLLVNGQRPDGTWRAGGQLPRQKRPEAETSVVSTMWIALALGVDARQDAVRQACERALAAVRQSKPGRSTEWHVARLLLAVQLSAGDLPRLRTSLEALQREDGGWGWLSDDESDALATGMALYALRQADTVQTAPEIRRAVQFLLMSQQEDGGWKVPGTKRQARGKPVETASYWGTCWAVIGLLEARPARMH